MALRPENDEPEDEYPVSDATPPIELVTPPSPADVTDRLLIIVLCVLMFIVF